MKNKKIKKYIQKQIQKQVSADFSGFDNRVYECEKTLGLTENSPSKEIFKSMMTDFNQRPFSWVKASESENEKLFFEPASEPVVSKAELTELPYKWCVKTNKITGEWFNKNRQTNSKIDYSSTKFDYLYYPKFHDCHIFDTVSMGYTEISFSDFERLVLKKPKELEVGKWYKGTYIDYKDSVNKSIFFVVKKHGDEKVCYGLNYKGMWEDTSSGWGSIKPSHEVEATKEEVESALIAEAEKLGFKEGMKIHSPKAEENAVLKHFDKYVYRADENRLVYMYNDVWGIPVFDNGKWAEIISQPEENIQKADLEIDFSVPGQLLRDVDGFVVFTSGNHSELQFEASIVQGPNRVGNYHSMLNKSEFKLFKGSICLKND